MATVDRTQLLADTLFWLPDSNVLPDASIQTIEEYVISQVGDDSANYSEILCKSLRACAIANDAKYKVDGASLKEERIGENTEKYFEGKSSNIWKDYINSLKDICPIFGYVPTTGFNTGLGIKISPSEPIVVNNCDDDSENLFL